VHLPLPLIPITEGDAKADFDELVKFDTRNLLRKGFLYTKANYKYSLSNWYINNNNVGRKSSNYFHQNARWKAKHQYHDSPYCSWTDKKHHKSILNPLWSLKMKGVNSNTLRQGIAMRKYLASQYPSAVAKEIYNLFGAKNVLDFSMGWGDRLAGFHASNAETYFGIDPNMAVYENYPKQNTLYNTGKKTIFVNSPAEDCDLSKHKFDMIFTSPPYFITEQYTDNEFQSWKRYGNSIEDWLNKFLFVTLNKCWNSLEDKGTMIINIADVYLKKEHWIKICDPMNDFISKLPGAHYSGCFGLRISKRPNSHNDTEESKDKQIIEPMWIWKKGDDRTLDNIINDTAPLSKFFI
jgi:hypothetical protein